MGIQARPLIETPQLMIGIVNVLPWNYGLVR